ncbi:MAG: tetratricopeptide repeat protein [Armatimonadota bacterium]|nr:tetratricopeptide repeat protein [Armatimonadota bacterium]MCX7776448.1 tetratricopeptide repeat protein [Armatimonadota bacterium]MDW8024246.1 tetratricopeptide repeat protein [Armatimonadota bacterium]
MKSNEKDWQVEAEIRNLLLRANVERTRGNYQRALELVKRAYELAPDNPQVLELYGDILRARGRLKEALEMYQAALQKVHHKPSVEEKIASLTLELSEIARQEELRAWLREHPEHRPRAKNPTLAVLASMMIPGAGQVYNGDFVKGFALFGVSLLSFAGWLTPVFDALGKAAKKFGAISLNSLLEVMRDWSTLKLVLLLVVMMVFFLAWTYAIIEAGITAFQLQKAAQLEFEEAFRRRKEENQQLQSSKD